jgi:predicted nucleic acid-binding protein
MTTAIDTNVLLDVLAGDERNYESSLRAIEESSAMGSIVICDLVYAELCVHFASQRECDGFLGAGGIRVESLTREASFLASRAFRVYRKRGGKRTRLLADFLIGAHAQLQAARLLSRDRGFYAGLFPELALVDPSR